MFHYEIDQMHLFRHMTKKKYNNACHNPNKSAVKICSDVVLCLSTLLINDFTRPLIQRASPIIYLLT
jgi:hypothetical protein